MVVLALDVGRRKVGIAVVDEGGSPRLLRRVNLDNLVREVEDLLARFPVRRVLIGQGTGYRRVSEMIAPLLADTGVEVFEVDEEGTTIGGRQRFVSSWPWPMKPLALLMVLFGYPVDHYAALEMALRYNGSVNPLSEVAGGGSGR